MKEKIYSVSSLIRQVNDILEESFRGIRVEGEISNFSRSGRGHLYFSLKDEKAQLDCVIWASTAGRIRFDLEDGLAVLVKGSLTIYPGRGRFQMIVTSIEPQGIGALQLAFEQLKARLAKEGLFDEERKRPLPSLPLRIGIVTSKGGAALRDMLKILRRGPAIDILVAPAAVQGDHAEFEVAAAIEALAGRGDRDLIIVGRGGGSLEDLWTFNTERVARAIAACPVPVISGVGHETDFSISDFVADLRAATPTHAAEIIVSRIEEKTRRVYEADRRIVRSIAAHRERSERRLRAAVSSAGLARLPERLRRLALRLARADMLPRLLLHRSRETRRRMESAEARLHLFPSRVFSRDQTRLIDSILDRMVSIVRNRLLDANSRAAALERALFHLSPHAVLARGYSITMIEGRKTPIRRAEDVTKGMVLETTLAEGRIRSLVVNGKTTRHRKKTTTPGVRQASLFDDGGENDEEN